MNILKYALIFGVCRKMSLTAAQRTRREELMIRMTGLRLGDSHSISAAHGCHTQYFPEIHRGRVDYLIINASDRLLRACGQR